MTDIAAKLQEAKLQRALRARIRFKSVVRHVMHNKQWLQDDDDDAEEAAIDSFDNVKKVVARTARKQVKRGALSIVEKAILRKPPESRTIKEKNTLNKVIGGLKCFRRYPEEVQFKLVSCTYFYYYGPNRVLVKQDHEAHAMYFILTGEVQITRRTFDRITNEYVILDLGKMAAGGMFGEVSLLHGVNRTATVTTTAHCELLVLLKEDFNNVLKKTIKARWDEIREAMTKFTYFDDWGDVAIRECCILSKIKYYEPNSIILGDGVDQGSQDMVYFVIEGSCAMIEHLFVREEVCLGKKYYHPYKPPVEQQKRISERLISLGLGNSPPLSPRTSMNISSTNIELIQSLEDELNLTKGNDRRSYEDFSIFNLHSLKSTVVPTKIVLPPNVKIRFMQVCIFEAKSTFFDNESLLNRRVIAKSNVKCLLVPSYWLIQHNQGNVWSRVLNYLTLRIPSKKRVFKNYVKNRRWQDYKDKLRTDILSKRRFPNRTTIHDVPYSIRVNSELD